jgi:O-antigen ligase
MSNVRLSWSAVAHGLLFCGAISVLIFPTGYTLFPLLAALCGWVVMCRKDSIVQSDSDVFPQWRHFAYVCWIYAAIAASIDIYHGVSLSTLEAYLPFAIYPATLWLYQRVSVKADYLFYGAAVGAILGVVWTVHQVIIYGATRPSLHGSAISFGNAGALLAVTCGAGLALSPSVKSLSIFWRAVMWVGVLSGATVSVLSGSKGGWLSLLTVLAWVVWSEIRKLKASLRWPIFGLAVTTVLIMATSPASPVNQRLTSALTGVSDWVATGRSTEGSVGPRLSMWLFGWRVLNENSIPITGFGIKEVTAMKRVAADAGSLDPVWSGPGHLHNEMLTTLMWRGPVGLAAHMAVYMTALLFFLRFRRSHSTYHRTVANAGVLTLVCFFEFGLTDGGWIVNANRQIFLMWVIGLIGALLSHRPPSENSPI